MQRIFGGDSIFYRNPRICLKFTQNWRFSQKWSNAINPPFFTVFGSKFSGLSRGIDEISEFLVICHQKGVIREGVNFSHFINFWGEKGQKNVFRMIFWMSIPMKWWKLMLKYQNKLTGAKLEGKHEEYWAFNRPCRASSSYLYRKRTFCVRGLLRSNISSCFALVWIRTAFW